MRDDGERLRDILEAIERCLEDETQERVTEFVGIQKVLI